MKAVVLLVLCCATVVMCAETFAAVDVSDSSLGLDRATELAGDSPVRQSQRLRVSERAASAEDGVSFLQSASHVHGGAAEVPGPALNRLTGAAKTYHPNDQMCVMCQFLVQRTQLDMAHFNAIGGFVGLKAAGANGAANAAAGGKDAGAKAETEEGFFIELGSSFGAGDDSGDWAAEDAEDAAAMEIAAKSELAETDGDWDAVAALEEKAHAIDAVVAEQEAEDSEEEGEDSEDEEDDASEEETEESVASQVAAAAFSETSATTVAADGLTAVERAEMQSVLSEMHNEAVADSVSAQIAEGMETTPVMVEADAQARAAHDSEDQDMVEEEVEVTPDMLSNGDRSTFINALGESFDSELNLSADEKEDMSSLLTGDKNEDSDWASPSYNADGSAGEVSGESQVVEAATDDSEDAVFLQIDEAETETETETADADAAADSEDAADESMGIAENVELIEVAANPLATRSYARTLHQADSDLRAPVFAEVSGAHAAFQSAGGLAQVSRRARRGPRGVGVANSPRRFRLADALNGRPRWNRFDPTVKPHPDPARAQAREMWHRLMQMTYDRLEGYCSTRLPEQFTPFCRPLLRRFRVVAEGIRYGDRPNQICMRTRFCPRGSYVRRSPHNVFKHVKG